MTGGGGESLSSFLPSFLFDLFVGGHHYLPYIRLYSLKSHFHQILLGDIIHVNNVTKKYFKGPGEIWRFHQFIQGFKGPANTFSEIRLARSPQTDDGWQMTDDR